MPEPIPLAPRAARMSGGDVLRLIEQMFDERREGKRPYAPTEMKILPTRTSDDRKVDTLIVQFGDDDHNTFYIDVEGVRE